MMNQLGPIMTWWGFVMIWGHTVIYCGCIMAFRGVSWLNDLVWAYYDLIGVYYAFWGRNLLWAYHDFKGSIMA